jgi:site-specific DNA recombinase
VVRVALYARVSGEEQAKSGYSLEGQVRVLKEHAAKQGMEVVGEPIVDEGISGAKLDRPGLRRIMELAEAGQIDEAIAMKRDRWFRSRLYRLMYEKDLKEAGVRLVSLNDTGNKIADGVSDDYAEMEREIIAERSRDGKMDKARRGEVVGGSNKAFGFDYRTVRDHRGRERKVNYVVNEAEMSVVRRVFRQAADGLYVREIARNTGRSRAAVRKMIHCPLHKPHTVEELRGLGVAESVMATLHGETYGVYSYRGIPVPIPDAGIPLEVVETARQRLGENTAPSSAGDREWELSGGMMRCGECGRQMATHPTRRNKKVDFYYRCPKRHETGDCANGNSFRADVVEPLVWETVREATGNRELVLQQASEHFAQLRRELPDPDLDTARLYKELEQVRMERKGYLKQNARGVLPDDELDELLAESDREVARLEEILETVRSRKERLAFIERDEAEIKSAIERGDLDEVFEPNDDFDEDHVAREPQWAYRQYRVRVGAYADGSLRVTWFGGRSVGSSELISRFQPTPTPKTNLPPETRSRLATSLAVVMVSRSITRATPVPTSSRSVAPAAAVSITNGSRVR